MSSATLPAAPKDAEMWLAHGGEMGRLIHDYDWAKSPIGPIESWSPALRMIVGFMLANRFPLLLWWGPNYVSIYNDPYRPVLGAKHPWALGIPVSECWSEIWHILKPLIDTPYNGGPATWMEDIELELNRHGFLEETHFTVAYSPVPDETAPRGIGGVLATVHEITEKVVGERRVAALRDLGASIGEAKSADEACARAASILARHGKDIPFVLLYLRDGGDGAARLVGAAGAAESAPNMWPLAEAARTEKLVVVDDLGGRIAVAPAGPWADAPHSAVVCSIPSNKPHEAVGFMVAGVSVRLKLDDRYRDFFELVRTQIATAIANARAFEEEKRRAEALAEIDRAKTAFFSNVSHEFRTPLTLMLGPVEDILAKPVEELPPPNRAALEVVHRNGQRLLRLVNTLLDFSRIEAGRAQASYEPTDLGTLTAELASNFRSACMRAGLRLAVDCPALDEPAWVDRDMWEKIVLNLLSNAFKFTLEGGISVSLRRTRSAFELVVRDTGTGIPPASLPRMFERFHRVEGARGRSHEGSGIGLALVQELVKLHGGTIAVQSEEGKGSAFTVTLPAGSAHLPRDRMRAPREAASTATRAGAFVDEALSWLPSRPQLRAPAATGPRVLLADDNADLRDYVRELLADRYDVEAVPDGVAALAAARERKPDLVVTDVMMPRLDGFGLIKALRADESLREVPVIALSARAGEEARIEGLGQGADDYLTKPFSARELLVRVEALLRSHRIRSEAREVLRASEQALKASEERYRTVLGLMPAAVYTCEAPSGRITYYNEHAVKLWGRTPAAGETGERFCACYKVWTLDGTFVPPERTPMAQSLREGTVFRDQEAVVERPDGTRFVAMVNIDPIRDAEGRVVGAINVFYDVTERRRAEERVRRSEQELPDFFETAAIGLHWVGPDGTILRANRAELDMLGYTAEEYIGRNIAEFHADRPVIDDILTRLTCGERLNEYPARLRCKDGSIRDVLINSSVLFEDGKFIHTRCFTADVTARKRAEASLNARARQQQTVATLGELALRERDLQKVFERSTAAIAKTLEVEYCKVLELLPDGNEVLLRAGVGWKEGLVGSARVDTGMDSQAGYTLAGGAPVIVRDLCTETRFRGPPLLTEHGVVSGMSCIIRGAEGEAWGVLGTHATRRVDFTDDDVSFLTAVANILGHAIQRERAEAALRESDRRKDEFIAMLSHELRNPLAPLRSRRGVLELRREPVQLADVLRTAVESAEPLVREAGHRLELDLPSEPLWLRGDPVRLAQTFANLLNNAARYTPRGGRIWVHALREADGNVCVSVRDNGAGFVAEAKAHLFEMFSRGERSIGLGIGLALVRKLVEMHGGSVDARSDGEGRGAEFLVRLPLERPPAAPPRAMRVQADGRSYRVLVADDNRDAAEGLAMLLRALGNEVSVAHDGIEAVEAVRDFRPQVVLLDIGMPRLDGYGAAREIRRQASGEPIRLVALTGWGQEEDKRRAREAGFDTHLVKPAELDALRRVLSDLRRKDAH